MKTHHPILTASITAADNLSAHIFVGFDGDVCGVGARAFGVTETAADAGEQASVNVLGMILVTAGAAIAAGAQVEADSNGHALTLAAGANNGVALDAATTAGDVIRIVRGI